MWRHVRPRKSDQDLANSPMLSFSIRPDSETKITCLLGVRIEHTIEGEFQLLGIHDTASQHRVERRGQDELDPATGSSTQYHHYYRTPWNYLIGFTLRLVAGRNMVMLSCLRTTRKKCCIRINAIILPPNAIYQFNTRRRPAITHKINIQGVNFAVFVVRGQPV